MTSMRRGKQRASEPRDEGLCDPPDVPSCSAEQHPGARSVPGPSRALRTTTKAASSSMSRRTADAALREPPIDTVEREGERRYRHHTGGSGLARGTAEPATRPIKTPRSKVIAGLHVPEGSSRALSDSTTAAISGPRAATADQDGARAVDHRCDNAAVDDRRGNVWPADGLCDSQRSRP